MGTQGPSYRDLIVWQKAMDLVVLVYEVTRGWPADERFGLISQTQRAAVSIPANIAEGQGRNSNGYFLRFLAISHGSLCELETHLLIAQRLGYVTDASMKPLAEMAIEVGRLLNVLIKSRR